MSPERLSQMLQQHFKYYFEDLRDPKSDKSAMYAEEIIKALGISMKANLGHDFYRAYGIIDDHVEEMISVETACRKLLRLAEELSR